MDGRQGGNFSWAKNKREKGVSENKRKGPDIKPTTPFQRHLDDFHFIELGKGLLDGGHRLATGKMSALGGQKGDVTS